MGFFSSLFSSNLCDERMLNYICEKMAERFVPQSIASAHALNYLAQYCGGKSNLISYKKIIEQIYNHISDVDWYMSLNSYKKPTNTEIDIFSHSPFSITIVKFMYYYLTRMPVILNSTTYDKKHFSSKEKDAICRACLGAIWKTTYHLSHYFNNDPVISLERDFQKGVQLNNEKEKMEFINDYRWFLMQPQGVSEVLPSIWELSENQLFMFRNILDENFIIFYKGLQNYLVDDCMFYLFNPDIIFKNHQ